MTKPKYGGQTVCGDPYCSPDPNLVRQLDIFPTLLEALEDLYNQPTWNRTLAPRERSSLERAKAAIKKAKGVTGT